MIGVKKVEIPIYNQAVYFLVGDPYEVQDYLRDKYCGDFNFNPEVSNAVALHRNLTTWIWFDPKTVTLPVVTHELDHAVFDLMIDLGLELTDQEAFCYLDEFLMEQCVNIFAIQMDPTKVAWAVEDDQV